MEPGAVAHTAILLGIERPVNGWNETVTHPATEHSHSYGWVEYMPATRQWLELDSGGINLGTSWYCGVDLYPRQDTPPPSSETRSGEVQWSFRAINVSPDGVSFNDTPAQYRFSWETNGGQAGAYVHGSISAPGGWHEPADYSPQAIGAQTIIASMAAHPYDRASVASVTLVGWDEWRLSDPVWGDGHWYWTKLTLVVQATFPTLVGPAVVTYEYAAYDESVWHGPMPSTAAVLGIEY